MSNFVGSGWILPTYERIMLGSKLHSDIVILFLTGLTKVDEILGNYCMRELKNFTEATIYNTNDIKGIVEDFAVLKLKWIKLGNNCNFNNNMTLTIADSDYYNDIIEQYQRRGYIVNLIPYNSSKGSAIELYEYQKLDIKDVISKGSMDLSLHT